MKLKTWLMAMAGALTLGLAGSSAQAAPMGAMGAMSDAKGNAAQSSGVQEVVWRRHCWWHQGHRHCRRYWDDGYGYYDDGYPYYGYGPGIGFFFGDGGHHRHHGHGHRGQFHGGGGHRHR